jgi:hypothetical protein
MKQQAAHLIGQRFNMGPARGAQPAAELVFPVHLPYQTEERGIDKTGANRAMRKRACSIALG